MLALSTYSSIPVDLTLKCLKSIFFCQCPREGFFLGSYSKLSGYCGSPPRIPFPHCRISSMNLTFSLTTHYCLNVLLTHCLNSHAQMFSSGYAFFLLSPKFLLPKMWKLRLIFFFAFGLGLGTCLAHSRNLE